MTPVSVRCPVVHLELHTGDLPAASAFYRELLRWRPESVDGYTALDVGGRLSAGMVQCGTPHAAWLPYVEVGDVAHAALCARELGATVMLAPREGPTGWRSVVRSDAGAEIAFWKPKR